LIALLGSGVPHVAFWRGVTRENLKVRFFHTMERRVLEAVDHVVVVSSEQHSFLTARGLPAQRVSLVPNAVDAREPATCGSAERESMERASAEPEAVGRVAACPHQRKALEALAGNLEGQTILTTAARLSPEKGQSFLIDAMPKIHEQKTNVKLIVFGNGPLNDKLRSRAVRLGCSENVIFAGLVPDFGSLVVETDIFVLPSLSEGLPNVLLEAMAASRPVVATRVGGIKDVLVDGVNGLLVPPADSKSLASAVLRLASDAELRGRLGQAARATVLSSYSFARQLELLGAVYRSLLRKVPVQSA
jgi:glycosyltransferase involved in cell wall biosynthesis